MGPNEIIEIAIKLKNEFKNKNVLQIIKELEINLSYTNLKPNLYPAYTVNYGEKIGIVLNNNFNKKQQNILAAHELGHAILHKNNYYNGFGGENITQEYEANLFAVVLLFDEDDFKIPLNKMSNFELKSILDHNINLEPAF